MDKHFIYNHPAMPQKEIVVGKKYLLEDLQKKFTPDEIKCFFIEESEIVEEVKNNKKK